MRYTLLFTAPILEAAIGFWIRYQSGLANITRSTPWSEEIAVFVHILVGMIAGLLLILAFVLDAHRSEKQQGAQRGREAGAILKWKSVDTDDRCEAIQQLAETGEQRTALRKRIFKLAIPYGAVAALTAGLWMLNHSY